MAREIPSSESDFEGADAPSAELPDEVKRRLAAALAELEAEDVRLPTSTQVAALLSALALAGPAGLGGMPVLPVTVDDQRRRQMDQIEQEGESSVGVHQDAQEAEAALALSQRRLAAVTREVEGLTTRVVSEADVVRAAQAVARGEATAREGRRFRQALGQVANDSVDLFILRSDEPEEPDDPAGTDEADEDLEAWLASFA